MKFAPIIYRLKDKRTNCFLMKYSGVQFMPNTTTSGSKTGIIKKLLVLLGVVAFLIISLLTGLVVFLPKIVSSARFKGFLESQASSAINRRVQIEYLKWEGTDEIIIKNMRLRDDPAFSNRPMLVAERARFQIFLGKILRGRLHFDLMLDGIHGALIRSRQGQTNMGMLLSGFEHSKAAKKEQAPIDLKKMSFTVPFDIQGRLHINNISIQVEDHMQAKQLALQNAAVRFDMPSLYSEPITLKASTDIKIDDHKIPAAHLNILIKNLFDPQGNLNITDSYIDMQGACPGAEFVLNSNMRKFKINSRLEIDLLKFTKILEPFIPPRVSPDKIMGNLKFNFDGSGNPEGSLSFNTTLEGQGLNLSGGVLGDKALGPLDFNVVNRGVLDAVRGRLAIENGALAFLKGSRLAWNGELKDLYGAAPEADLKLNSIQLDIAELFDKFKAFMPKGITIEGKTQKHSPVLEIKHTGFSGPLLSGPHDIRINDLVLELPVLHFSSQEPQSLALSVTNVRLDVKNLSSTLEEFFPAQVNLTAALSADSIDVKGAKDIYVKKLSIPDITVVSDEIHRSKNPLMGLSARFKVREALTVNEISIPPLITVNNFQEILDAEVEFPPNTPARVAVTDLMLKIPALIIENSNYGPFKTNAGLNCRVDGILLLDMDPLDVDIKGIQSDLRVDNILVADFESDAENMAREFVKAKGNVLIDMVQLSEKLIAKFTDKLKLTGETKLNWDIEGRLPNEKEITNLGSSSIDLKDDLGFIDRMNIDCTVKDMGVDLAVSEGKHLKVESVSTGSPIKYSFDNKTGKGQSGGKLLLRGINVPYNVVIDKNLSADILVSGEHNHLKSITFSQVGVLKPVNINHTLNISLNGMDQLFKRSLKMPFPSWFKYVGGAVRGTLNVSEQTNLTMLVDNLDFEGQLETGAELLLVPGESIRLIGWASSPEINVKLGELFSVKNLKTNVNLEKDYRIIEAEEAEENENRFMPLSVRVLKAESEPAIGGAFEFDTQDAAVAKLIGALQNRFSQQHALTFESAYMGIGPLPLAVERSLIGFDLNEGLPNSDYFQVELLGGTVIGSFTVIEKNDAFFLKTQLAFSGLNTDRIYPAAGTLENDDSELSGRLAALIPLSSRLESLQREFQMDLKLSRIGSRSLERLLYALDPAESNEAIVSQRQLLRMGFPRRIYVHIQDGNLSIEGEIDVQGVPVEIPSLRRLNVANISGLDKYADYLVGLVPVIKTLKFCSANAIKIGENGQDLKFKTLK